MVRVKHRYLLVHILYPDPVDDAKAKTPPSKSPEKAPPDLVQFHRPSPDDLTPQLLARTIRDQVQLLYGDYGLGLASGGLSGTILPPTHTSLNNKTPPPKLTDALITKPSSQIPLPRDLDRHHPLLSRALPTRLGSFVLHDAADGYFQTGATDGLRGAGR